MLTITLPSEVEARLQGEALRHGLAVADYARQLIECGLAKPVERASGSSALSKWESMNETDDAEEIARRQQEFEEFKAGMNRNRLEAGGPDARKVYP